MKKSLFITSLMLISFSCKKEKLTDIDSRILLTLKTENNRTTIYAQTEKEYGTSGYHLVTKSSSTKNKYHFNFKGISTATTVLTVLTPATTKLELGNLARGSYNISIKLNKKTTEGVLIINDTARLSIGNKNIIEY